VLVAVVAASLTACSSSDSSGGDDAASSPKASVTAPASARPSSPASQAAPRKQSDVKIVKAGVEDHPVWGPRAYVVHYVVTNHGKEPADYFAQVEFLDKDGDHLGNTGITADKLGVGKSKAGDIAPLDVEIQNGKIADIRSVRVSEVQRTPAA
jgi:hypothetical protein